MPSEKPVMILGGNGAVGGRVVDILASTFPGSVICAGRTAAQYPTRAGVTNVSIDATSTTDLRAVLSSHRVGLLVVAMEATPELFEACVGTGVHAIDISASRTLHEQVERLHNLAVSHSTSCLLSVGLAPGLTNALAWQADRDVGGAARIDISLLLGLGDTHGAAALDWTLLQLGHPSSDRPATRLLLGRRRRLFPFPFPDQYSLRQTLGVDAVTTRICFESRIITELVFAARRTGLLRWLASDRWRTRLIRWVRVLKVGSDDVVVQVEARTADEVASRSVTGRQQSTVTAHLAAQAAVAVLRGTVPPGVRHIDEVPGLRDAPQHHLPGARHTSSSRGVPAPTAGFRGKKA